MAQRLPMPLVPPKATDEPVARTERHPARPGAHGVPMDLRTERRIGYTETGDQEASAGEPLTLHRHDTEGHLGGAVYSAPFAAYLGQTLATHRAIDDGQHAEWWRNAYLARRLRAQMMTYPHGGRAYLAILAMERDGMTLETAAGRCGKSDVWLRRMIVRLHSLVAEYRRVGAQRRARRILPSQHNNLSVKAS